MAQGEYWSNSQKQAWQYVISAIEGGLNQTEALEEYRLGGGAIRTSSWGELWHRGAASSENWSTLYKLKPTDTVPESMYAETGINYQNKYVATFEFRMRSVDGQTITTEYRTLESSQRLTMEEWLSGLGEAAYDYVGEGYGSVLSITNIEFFENMNIA